MAVGIGLALALAVGLFGTLVGFDRERSFYPVVTIVIAALYALFALVAADADALLPELGLGLGFVIAAVLGFRRSLWIAVVALAAHGLLDAVHPQVVANEGVPPWWPAFCAAYDLAAAAYLAVLLLGGRVAAAPARRAPATP